MTAISEPIELYPYEYSGLQLIWAHLQRKYGGRMNTLENLMALRNEAIERFRDELGLEIDIDVSGMQMGRTGEWMTVPEITVMKRVVAQDVDHQRMSFEVQHGFADGVVGALNEKGAMVEPSAQIAMPGGS